MISLTIDGLPVSATPGMTVLQAADNAGISIPRLCHHDKLEPFGACRLCLVEADWSRPWRFRRIRGETLL